MSSWAARFGWKINLVCFGMILSWSRYRMWWFTTSEDRHHTFEGIARFFDQIDGVPTSCRTDRMGALGRSQGRRFVRSAMARPVCARRLTDEAVKPKLLEVFNSNYRVYGRRKMKAALRRQHNINLDKDRIARLMRELGIRGATRTKTTVTTRSDRSSPRAPDLVNRRFCAQRTNQLWVCDFTYVATWSGFVYTAFVTDVFSRRIVGWRTAASMTTPLVMDALDMAIFSRRYQLLDGVIAHSDAGSQYVSVSYTERLAEINAHPSIGSIGDSFDNAMAETVNGLYKTELIRRQGPWRNVEHVELATLAWVEWFNNQRLHGELGDIPPAEFEANYYARPRAETKTPTPTRI